jgi:hypothetical protein
MLIEELEAFVRISESVNLSTMTPFAMLTVSCVHFLAPRIWRIMVMNVRTIGGKLAGNLGKAEVFVSTCLHLPNRQIHYLLLHCTNLHASKLPTARLRHWVPLRLQELKNRPLSAVWWGELLVGVKPICRLAVCE